MPYLVQTAVGEAGTGWRVEYIDGHPCFAAPIVDGKVHGHTVQWDLDGQLLSVCRFDRGTGVDYWCDDTGALCEEHPDADGLPHGVERWWDQDQQTVYIEVHWATGQKHGIERYWTEDQLDEGFPRFWIRGEQVDREAYASASAQDEGPPSYRIEDDDSRRAFPAGFRRRITRSHPDEA